MSNKTIIIAEAGVNHNGSMEMACKLIDAAAYAGVDYVKFQTFVAELVADKTAKKAEYQQANDLTGVVGQSQYDMIKQLELPFEKFIILQDYAKSKGLKFLTTAADLQSLSDIDQLNLDYIKVSSGELTNILFLRQVAKKGIPTILSTGMATLGEIEIAINTLLNAGLNRSDITILHCNTEYPTPYEDVNLKAMLSIASAFDVKIGYSDHTLGIEIPIAAVALGATIIEKHFTLDKNLPGPDHSASLEPLELKKMVHSIRNIEKALALSGVKTPSNSEAKNILIVRKSIFAAVDIKQGEMFTENNLLLKRPGDGIPAIQIDQVLGKRAAIDISCNKKIDYKDISWSI